MMFSKRPPPAESSEQLAGDRGVDFAWRTHSAITDWTARVDTKSSIVLSLGGVVLGFMITLSTKGRLLGAADGCGLLLERTGLGLVGLGVFLAAFAVWPRLKRRQANRIWQSNYVYFGHLKHWDPRELKQTLLNQSVDEQLDVLSAQLVTASKISWNKHATLQGAMLCLTIGVLLVAAGAAWPK